MATDEQIMNYYNREIRPGLIKLAYKDWWRIVRCLRQADEMRANDAVEAADRIFAKSRLYHAAQVAWAYREYKGKSYSLRDVPKFMVQHRMRKVGMWCESSESATSGARCG